MFYRGGHQGSGACHGQDSTGPLLGGCEPASQPPDTRPLLTHRNTLCLPDFEPLCGHFPARNALTQPFCSFKSSWSFAVRLVPFRPLKAFQHQERTSLTTVLYAEEHHGASQLWQSPLFVPQHSFCPSSSGMEPLNFSGVRGCLDKSLFPRTHVVRGSQVLANGV